MLLLATGKRVVAPEFDNPSCAGAEKASAGLVRLMLDEASGPMSGPDPMASPLRYR